MIKFDAKEKGITLIAIIITIIVLLILAGVAIASISGNNGILTRAGEAKNRTNEAAQNEQNSLNTLEDQIDYYVDKNFAGLETKQLYNATWVKVFYHNIKNGTALFSTDKIEALNVDTEYKYSILGRLEEFREDTSQEFEFLLECPEVAGYNRWAQTSNPCTTQEVVTGYRAIDISWTGMYWGGLCKSSSTTTLIDGSVGYGDWWYAIGLCTPFQNTTIPGPGTIRVQKIYLWLRVL